MITRRTGRRPGRHDTRADILAAARRLFAERGYDSTSVRQVATSAGVDSALVHHYFGTKQNLFRATIEAPIDPATLLPAILAGEPDELGQRILTAFLGVWEHPDTGPAMRATVRSAVASEESARLLREFFATQIVRRIISELDVGGPPEERALRASFVASQLFGIAVIRYVLRFEPLASLSSDTIAAVVGPAVQRYLVSDLAA